MTTARKGCIPLLVNFSAVGATSISGATFNWDLGSGSYLSGSDTISKIFSISGKYTIRMQVNLPGGSGTCLVRKDTFISVLPTPTPIMSILPGTVICNRGKAVLFNDTTTGAVKSEWIIEGNSYKSPKVSYNYTSGGNKSVSLSSTNAYGCTGLSSQSIQVYDSLFVDFCVSVNVNKAATYPVLAYFTPRTSNPGTRKIVSYNWYFPGSNIPGATKSVTKTTPFPVGYSDYTKKYDVALTVVMDDGCSYTMYRKGFISPFLTPTFQQTCAGKTLTINADLSDTGRHNYQFGFPGADQVSTGVPPPPDPKTVFVTYNKTGTYDATIKYIYKTPVACTNVINYAGIFSVLGPKADFDSKDNLICKGTDTVHFINKSDVQGAPNVKYTWYIYDSVAKKLVPTRNKLGPTGTADTFYVPGVNGKLSVGLVATSTNGCSDSVVKTSFISINSPKSDFVIANKIGCLNADIPITAKPNPPEGKIVKYKYNWVVKNEADTNIKTNNTGQILDFKPGDLGNYSVQLTVSNGHCTSDTTKHNFLTVIGDKTDISIADHTGCLNPTFITQVGLTKEIIYPNDPFNPPTYQWSSDPGTQDDIKFLSPYESSTAVEIYHSGCYPIYLTITTHIGKDTCRTKYSKEGNQAICVGPGLSFSVGQTKCLGDTIPLYNYSDGAAHNFKWSVTPKGLAKIIPYDTSANPSIIFYADTCYQIKLAGEKLIGGKVCRDSMVDSSVCLVATKADFEVLSPVIHCAPAVVRFVNKSTNGKSYLYRFDDGDSLYTRNDTVVHVYLKLKKSAYNVSLTAYDTFGCSNTVVKSSVLTVDGPVPHIEIDKKTGCDTVTVSFKNTSKNVNSFVFLYDDDASPVFNRNPARHTYRIQDSTIDSVIYNPTLLSTDDSTCKVFYSDTLKLYRTPSDVKIHPDKTFGCTPLYVQFGSTSKSGKGWKWDFDGDGIIDDSMKATTSFRFMKPGKYVPRLTVTNHGHCPYTVFGDTIYVIPNAVPAFVPSYTKFCGKKEIVFKNTSTNYSRFIFDYGDGSPIDSNVIANHTYYFDPAKDKGDSVQFFLKLIAYNAAGCSDTFRQTLTSYAVPDAGFKTSVVSGCAPLKVRFTDTSTYSFGTRWDFDNDGKIDAYGRVADYTYQPGIYTVKMISFSVHGCIDSVVHVNLIVVNDPPKPDFAVSDTNPCFKSSVQFTNLTQPAAHVTKWLWQFDDPSAPFNTSTQKELSYRYYTKGNHDVALTAIDDKGCTGYIKKHAVFVEDTLPPANTKMLVVTVADTNSVTISWNKSNINLFKGYRLNRLINGKAVAVYTTTDANDTVYTENNPKINTSGQNYCYSIQTINTCGKVSFASYSHCTILLNLVANNGPENDLSWTPYIGWQPLYYRIYRAGADGKIKKIDSVPGTKLKYADSMLCDETYCYYVEAINSDGTLASRSNITCLHANYVRQTRPVNLHYATDVDNSAVQLTWDTIAYKNQAGYVIDRNMSGYGWQENYATSVLNSWRDNNVDINNTSYDYRVHTIDLCGYNGPVGNIGRTMVLHAAVKSDRVELHWNGYRYWQSGLKTYKVQVRLKDRSFRTIASVNDTTYTDDSVYNTIDTAYCYRIIAYNNLQQPDSSVSNLSCAVLPSRTFVPNAFTPGNHDSLNDVWRVSAVSVLNVVGQVHKFKARIFNRWGILVWESDDLHAGWDGTWHGQTVPMDVYIYMVDIESVDGRNLHLKGNVTVVR